MIQIGKFDIAVQNGTAGNTVNGVKYAREHTGRASHMKQARGVSGDATAIINLTVNGKPSFMTVSSNAIDIAWDTVTAQVTVSTNAEKFRISSDGKAVTLQSSASYTVNGLVGTFTGNLGLESQHAVVLTFGLESNQSNAGVTAPVLVEYWDGSEYKTAGTFTINQSSADADVSIVLTPSTLPVLSRAGESKTISVDANVAYSIQKQGADLDWFSISRTSGVVGVAELEITVAAQAVAAAQRTGTIVFKNPVSGSTIVSLTVTQTEGEGYAISITPSSLTFESSELNVIKNVTVTANAAWQIEEVVA